PFLSPTYLQAESLTQDQVKAVQHFSKTLTHVANSAPHLVLDPIQKHWNKICYELIQEPAQRSKTFSERIRKIEKRVAQVSDIPTNSHQKTKAEEVYPFVRDINADKDLSLHYRDWRIINATRKMVERVMDGAYGSTFKQKLLTTQK